MPMSSSTPLLPHLDRGRIDRMKQVPMKQILLVVGTLLWWLTAGGLLPPTSYAASPPASHTRISSGLGWGALPYFNLSQSERFYVTTNRTWTGAREVQADAFNGYVASQYANWAGPKGERVAAIWSPRCTRRAQHIVLTRTVLLPGIPSQDRKTTRLNPSHANNSYAVF